MYRCRCGCSPPSFMSAAKLSGYFVYEAPFGRITSSTRSVSHVEEVASIRLDQELWQAAGSTAEATPARPRCVIGLVARSGPRGRGLFAYFFDLRSDEVPELSDLPAFTAKAA